MDGTYSSRIRELNQRLRRLQESDSPISLYEAERIEKEIDQLETEQLNPDREYER